MTSPLIDEETMMQALQVPETDEPLPASYLRLRTGASMLLLDAFDRKVTRDQFLAALGAAVTLIDATGKYEMISNVGAFEKDRGTVTKVDIEVALHSIKKIIESGCDQCIKMASLLKQCPMDEDKVH